jgi:hypothetical protein
MNPKRFLFLGGSVLVTVGILGISGILGALSRASFFHPPYWINWVHLSFGGVVLSVAAWGTRKWQSALAFLATVMGLTLGLLGLLFGPAAAKRFSLPELADPSDHTAHLLVGLMALWGWLGRKDK